MKIHCQGLNARTKPAQGNALGFKFDRISSPERAAQRRKEVTLTVAGRLPASL
jgi:hypothetical protein